LAASAFAAAALAGAMAVTGAAGVLATSGVLGRIETNQKAARTTVAARAMSIGRETWSMARYSTAPGTRESGPVRG
jgi:hypothetical protein